MTRRDKWVIAHRGAHSRKLPENTIAAFREAIRLGASMVEFDVRRVADGTLVIHHDAEIARQPLSGLAWGKLHALGSEAGVVIPTLAQTLEFCAGRISLLIEVKEPGFEPQLLDALFAARYGLQDYIVISFLPEVLHELRHRQPGSRIGLLTERQSVDEAIAGMRSCQADFLCPWFGTLDAAFLARCTRAAVRLLPWTVGRLDLDRLLDAECVAGVITEEVSLALQRQTAELG